MTGPNCDGDSIECLKFERELSPAPTAVWLPVVSSFPRSCVGTPSATLHVARLAGALGGTQSAQDGIPARSVGTTGKTLNENQNKGARMRSDPVNRVPTALASVRRFVAPRRPSRERCALCDAELPVEHSHLLETATRQLRCACEPCAILFSNQGEARYRRVPRDVRLLRDFRLPDVAWQGLSLPIDLAFFVRSTAAGGIVALYPSPAGATESPVAAEAWGALAEENPVLRAFEPDVEALLVNRLGQARECYRVGVDECYRLVGLVRAHWRGLSGGGVWQEIDRYFAGLKERSGDA